MKTTEVELEVQERINMNTEETKPKNAINISKINNYIKDTFNKKLLEKYMKIQIDIHR